MSESIARFMGVSAIKRGEEAAFLRALAECREELTELLGELRAGACSLFRQGRYVFLYAEFPDAGSGGDAAQTPAGRTAVHSPAPQTPEAAAARPDAAALQAERIWRVGGLKPLLAPWPSLHSEEETYMLRLNDIFHDDVQTDDVPWRRPDWKPARRAGKLARLKPEMYASYVFLHYQLQEEQPRLFSKYYTIGSFGPYIFSYDELPGIVEPPRAGRLDTKRTPADWPAAMLPHFEPWGPEVSEGEQLWRETESLFHLETRE